MSAMVQVKVDMYTHRTFGASHMLGEYLRSKGLDTSRAMERHTSPTEMYTDIYKGFALRRKVIL